MIHFLSGRRLTVSYKSYHFFDIFINDLKKRLNTGTAKYATSTFFLISQLLGCYRTFAKTYKMDKMACEIHFSQKS